MVKEKKDTKELLNELEQEMVRVEKEKVDLRNDKERIAYLEHLCENIKEAKKQCEDIKFEYGQVTSYLKDIQLIDRAPKEYPSVRFHVNNSTISNSFFIQQFPSCRRNTNFACHIQS